MPHNNPGATQCIQKPAEWKSNIIMAFIQLRFLIRRRRFKKLQSLALLLVREDECSKIA